MARKILQVYRSDEGWIVQKEGASCKSSRRNAKLSKRHGRSPEFGPSSGSRVERRDSRARDLRDASDSGLAKEEFRRQAYRRAVGAVTLERVKATSTSTRATKK